MIIDIQKFTKKSRRDVMDLQTTISLRDKNKRTIKLLRFSLRLFLPTHLRGHRYLQEHLRPGQAGQIFRSRL